jgi:hypothetical protein
MTTEKTQVDSTISNIPDFGSGRYANIAKEVYRDAKRLLKLSEKESEKLARTYTSELGRLLVAERVDINQTKKQRGDGYVSLKESTAKLKNVKLSSAMRIAKILSLMDDARTFGVIEFAGDVKLDADLVDWLAE